MRVNYNELFVNMFSGASLVLIIALCVLFIIGFWRIFTKAGEKGWKSLIPIYNEYVYFRIAWEGKYFWYTLALNFVSYLIIGLLTPLGDTGATIGLLIAIACGVATAVITCKTAIRMAHRFNKSTGFGVIGLWLFQGIGQLIIGLGDADYDVRRDNGDGIWRQNLN